MGILIALVFIAAVGFLVSRLRPGTPDDPEWYERERESEPERLGVTTLPSEGWVVLRTALREPEAKVAQGLLEANGIRAVLESTAEIARLTMAHPVGAGGYRLAVPEDQAEVARALLDDPT